MSMTDSKRLTVLWGSRPRSSCVDASSGPRGSRRTPPSAPSRPRVHPPPSDTTACSAWRTLRGPSQPRPGSVRRPRALRRSFASLCSRCGSRSSTFLILWFQHRCSPASGHTCRTAPQIAALPSAIRSRGSGIRCAAMCRICGAMAVSPWTVRCRPTVFPLWESVLE